MNTAQRTMSMSHASLTSSHSQFGCPLFHSYCRSSSLLQKPWPKSHVGLKFCKHFVYAHKQAQITKGRLSPFWLYYFWWLKWHNFYLVQWFLTDGNFVLGKIGVCYDWGEWHDLLGIHWVEVRNVAAYLTHITPSYCKWSQTTVAKSSIGHFNVPIISKAEAP